MEHETICLSGRTNFISSLPTSPYQGAYTVPGLNGKRLYDRLPTLAVPISVTWSLLGNHEKSTFFYTESTEMPERPEMVKVSTILIMGSAHRILPTVFFRILLAQICSLFVLDKPTREMEERRAGLVAHTSHP